MSSASAHSLNPKQFLRQTFKHDHYANKSNAEQESAVFPVLLDTGCSTACSGYIDDFNGELAYGSFGQIKTADGVSPIKGFGILQYDVYTDDGSPPISIRVPGYFVPNVEMRLLSPQDYVRFHRISVPGESSFAGNAELMVMTVLKPDNTLASISAMMDFQSRLPFLSVELTRHNREPTTCSCKGDHAHTTSCVLANTVSDNIYDDRNSNLSQAQKLLKLDHDRLGHVSFRRLQAMYQCQKRLVHFDGTSTSESPCLLAPDKRQILCSAPLCATCQYARARRRTAGTKHSKPDLTTTDVLRADDLSPGQAVLIDQYESSVRGRLPSSRG